MPGKDATDPPESHTNASEQPTESITQPTSVIPFNVDPAPTSGTNPAGGAPPTDPPATPPSSGGPGGGGPDSGEPHGLFASNWARLAALVGGIIVTFMLIGGAAIGVAAVIGNLGNDNHRRGDTWADGDGRGFGDRGRHGFMGRERDRSGEDNQQTPGQGRPGGQGPGQRLGQDPGQGGLMGLLPGAIGGVEHGDFTMRGADGNAVTMRMVRGTVTDVTAKAITVKASDGYTVAYALNSTTKVSRNRASVAPGSVVKGDSAIALGSVSGKTATATFIAATSAPQ